MVDAQITKSIYLIVYFMALRIGLISCDSKKKKLKSKDVAKLSELLLIHLNIYLHICLLHCIHVLSKMSCKNLSMPFKNVNLNIFPSSELKPQDTV